MAPDIALTKLSCDVLQYSSIISPHRLKTLLPRAPAPSTCLMHRGMGWGGRWGEGIGIGNTCKSMADHVNVWQKLLQYCKVISLQLTKINGKQKQKQTKKNLSCLLFQ